MCGVFFDSMSGGLASRFAGEELPGKMTALQNLFFRVSFQGVWTDTWKLSATLMMSHDLAMEKALAWDALTDARRRVLRLYGIDAGRWEIIRAAETQAADGRHILLRMPCWKPTLHSRGSRLLRGAWTNCAKRLLHSCGLIFVTVWIMPCWNLTPEPAPY